MESSGRHDRWWVSVPVVVGLAVTLLALRPAQVSTATAMIRPAPLTLCCPGRIDQQLGMFSDSKFTVNFDRIPGQPGATKMMHITWYGLTGPGANWSVVLGTGAVTPLACLSADVGMHEVTIPYTKPAGLEVIRLLPFASGCSGAGGLALADGVVLQLE